MLDQDELASALADTLQHAGLQGCCLLTAQGLSSALPSQDLGAFWERARLEQLLMLSQDRGEVLWQAAGCRSFLSWDCPQQELPEHTAALHQVTSWLALSFHFCLWSCHGLGLREAHFSQTGGWVCLFERRFALFQPCGLGSLSFRSIAWCKSNFFGPA